MLVASYPGILKGGDVWAPRFTPDGRFLVFASLRDDLVQGDTNAASDVFVRDMRTGEIERVSVSSLGIEALGGNTNSGVPEPMAGSFGPDITPNGRFVAFGSFATNLVSNDRNRKADVFLHDRWKGATSRVSVSATGLEANGHSLSSAATGTDHNPASISADGRLVSFGSLASNLVPKDTNDVSDIFVKDRRTGTVERVSVASNEAQGDGESVCSSMDRAGRRIVFASRATNFGPDAADRTDVYVRDRKRGTTQLVNVASDGTPADHGTFGGSYTCMKLGGDIGSRAISPDGRFVVFISPANNLVPNDTSNDSSSLDLFVRDLVSRRTERISVTSYGEQRPGVAWPVGMITSGGRYTVFASTKHLDPVAMGEYSPDPILPVPPAVWEPLGDHVCVALPALQLCRGGDMATYLHDRITGVTEIISVTNDGKQIRCANGTASVTDSGRKVAFLACPGNDQFRAPALFLRDRGDAAGTVPPPGSAALLTGNGVGARSAVLATDDAVGDVGASDAPRGADLMAAQAVQRRTTHDVFVTLDVTRIPGLRGGIGGVPAAGDPGIVYGLRFRAGKARYEVRAGIDDLPGGAVHSFALFDCSATPCRRIADLRGGYGTTGERIVFSVPLSLVRSGGAAQLTSLQAFSAIGTIATGPVTNLDAVAL